MKTQTCAIAIIAIALCISEQSHQAEAQELAKKNRTGTALATSSVGGLGTSGRISKWAGVSGTSTYVLGDSNIFEDKFGKIGIGTTAPSSLLTVEGMIAITLGGLKFPDGSIQSTAFNPTQVVRSLNGLSGDVQLAAGTNITIIPNGNTLTIAATNALSGVTHDMTLTGNGTQATPLGVAVPLVLSGAEDFGIIQATNTIVRGAGVFAEGGPSDSSFGGGPGVFARGGVSVNLAGGPGVNAFGGSGSKGGTGVFAFGGSGSSTNNGPAGVEATGGSGSGAGRVAGAGIIAAPGPALNGASAGLAGQFNGNVQVTGTLSKGGGSFKIDHPLDPENKYLYHSFVESPDMMNIYNGNVVTNELGEAVVVMPGYFEALNGEFRYQLTVIGTFAQAIIADEIKGNRFTIKTNAPSVKVSWQVTGVRRDAYANKNRIPVEEDKPDPERSYYLHPEAFNQPEEKSINWARDPEMMKQLKQRRRQEEQRLRQQPNQR